MDPSLILSGSLQILWTEKICSSIFTAIGFVIDGEPVYWERANETEVNSASFTIFDPIEKKVIIEF